MAPSATRVVAAAKRGARGAPLPPAPSAVVKSNGAPAGVTKSAMVAASDVVVQLWTVTPEIAAQWLETINTNNRPVRESRVNRYARDMVRGDWTPNGDTIKLARDGTLLDGQHRLWAIVMSNTTQPMLVATNVDPMAMRTIDTGAPRTFADVLRIRSANHMPYLTNVPALLRLLIWYERTGGNSTDMNVGVTHAELDAALEANPDVVDACRAAMSTAKLRRLVAPSVLSLIYLLASRVDPGKAGAWLAALDSGAGLTDDHPCYLMREILVAERSARDRMPMYDILFLLARSWSNYRRGARLRRLIRPSSGDRFPTFA